MRTTMLLAASALLLPSCMAQTDVGTRAGPPSVEATTQLLGANGEMRGTATLSQETGGTRVRARVEGLREGSYAIHVHAVGKCEGPKFTTAGPHFNPTTKLHGRDNPMGPHLGDLPNVTIGASGTGTLDATIGGLMLTGGATPVLDADGAAVVLHAGPDDYRTDPSGNSGDRIACGTLASR